MIDSLLNSLKEEEDKIYLQTRTAAVESESGVFRKDWEDVKELDGIIKINKQERKDGEKGEKDQTGASDIGLFLPFDIENMQDYRIRRVKNEKEELYDIVKEYPNLVIHGEKHHIRLGLRLK